MLGAGPGCPGTPGEEALGLAFRWRSFCASGPPCAALLCNLLMLSQCPQRPLQSTEGVEMADDFFQEASTLPWLHFLPPLVSSTQDSLSSLKPIFSQVRGIRIAKAHGPLLTVCGWAYLQLSLLVKFQALIPTALSDSDHLPLLLLFRAPLAPPHPSQGSLSLSSFLPACFSVEAVISKTR